MHYMIYNIYFQHLCLKIRIQTKSVKAAPTFIFVNSEENKDASSSKSVLCSL